MLVLSPFAVVCLLCLFVLHFVADFMCQTDWMALNKSKWYETFQWPQGDEGLDALLTHTLIYGLSFLVFGWKFALITFVAHTLTDALTSQLTSKFWFIDFFPVDRELVNKKANLTVFRPDEMIARVHAKRRHWFFVAIGFDQLLHQAQLVLTFWFLFAR